MLNRNQGKTCIVWNKNKNIKMSPNSRLASQSLHTVYTVYIGFCWTVTQEIVKWEPAVMSLRQIKHRNSCEIQAT